MSDTVGSDMTTAPIFSIPSREDSLCPLCSLSDPHPIKSNQSNPSCSIRFFSASLPRCSRFLTAAEEIFKIAAI